MTTTDLVQVRIKGLVSSTRYGTLVSGDILRTDAAYARHLVEELRRGEYINPPAAEPAVIRRLRKARKAA